MLSFNKRTISLLLAALFLFTGIVGCVSKNESTSSAQEVAEQSPASEPAQKQASSSSQAQLQAKSLVKVAVLKGPTGMGMTGLMESNQKKESTNMYEFKVAGAPDEITGDIINGSVDIAAIPTNLASVLYNKTEKKVSVMGINTLGVLYILSSDDSVSSLEDLKGKTIYATGQGATPEYVLNYLLEENGLKPGTDVTIEYKAEHAELAALMASGQVEIALLPEPFVTTVTTKKPEVKVAVDITEEWEKATDGTPLTTGSVIVRNDFLEKNKEAVDAFLAEYAASVSFVNDSPAEAAALCEKFDIIAADIAEKAIPSSNIVSIEGNDMQQAISKYLDILFAADPKAVGGAVPDEGFYYKRG